MEVATLKSHIQRNALRQFYIFTGEEWKVQQIYIDQIVKVSGKQKRYAENMAEVFSKLKGRSIIKQSYVYILRDDKDLMTNEKLQDSIVQTLGDNMLILLVTSLDKRTKFAKKYANDIIEFERLSPKILKKYVQKETPLSDRNCERLMEVCEYDYGRCLLEIDKLKQYRDTTWLQRNERERDGGIHWTNECFEILLKDGTIYLPPYDAIFDFVDAVLKRQTQRAFSLLYQSYAVGEATMVLLSVLYNNARQVLQVQTCEGRDPVKTAGLTAWQVKCARERIGYYSNDDLMYLLELVQKCELGIKTGRMEEQIALEYVLVHIF